MPPAPPAVPPADSPRASDPRAGEALPPSLHDRPAATLLVDLDSSTVVFANSLAAELAPDVGLPCSLADWSRAAELHDEDGRPLEEGDGLADLAQGRPHRGRQVDAARASDESAPREALWAIGVPLGDAPAPLTHQALVIFLPIRQQEAVRELQEAGDDLHARAASASELSFTISDPHQPDDPLVWVNPAFERVTGYSAEEVLGRNCRFLQGEATDRAVVARMRAALDEGRTVADTLLNYRKDGTPFWNQVVISPVVDANGEVTHHVGIQADVTDQVETQRHSDDALSAARVVTRRLQLLARVSEEIATHLDYDDAVAALADVAVPALAAWGFVTVTSDRGRHERVHLRARDPEQADLARALAETDLAWLRRSPRMAEAMALPASTEAQPFEIDGESLTRWVPQDQLALLHRLGVGNALIVPLHARDRVVGALCLVNPPGEDFSRDQVQTALHVGGRAGVALDNVRLYLRERSAALTLQHSLLPEVPELDDLDVAASYLPALHRAEVGGDWFDVLPLPDGSVGLAVGDVVGHDLQAAASMGQLRSVLRSYAWSGESTSRVMARLDELVQGLDMADMSTCVYLRLQDDRLTYSRAGHPPPLVRSPDGEVCRLDDALATPIGVPNLDPFVEAEAALTPGSLLVVYTDGLVERRNRTLREGIDRLARELVELPSDLTAAQVRDSLLGQMIAEGQEDDVCVLVVRRP